MRNRIFDWIKPEDVTQILLESDCSKEFTQQFLTVMDSQGIGGQLRLLETQRARLLEQVHIDQRKLEGLDHLRYILQKYDHECKKTDNP